MFEQLTELVKQYGGEAVVNNPAVPNDQNDAVMNEASSSIVDGLKNILLIQMVRNVQNVDGVKEMNSLITYQLNWNI